MHGFDASAQSTLPTTLPVVKACGHHDYPPWNWEKGGEIVGACAMVARRAIERLGYRVDLSYVGPWKRCQMMVNTGQVDVNICAFRNREREATSVIVEPRMGQNSIAVFVRQGAGVPHSFTGWDDLKGLRTGLIGGVSMGPEFDTFLMQSTTIDRAPDLHSVLNMLDLGRVDIAPFGLEAGRLAVERLGMSGRIVPLDKPALLGDLYVIVSKKSPLASRARDIGKYFERSEYRDELAGALSESSRLYLESTR
jgi:polar amino acid transport system substrate-binding protein